MRGLVLLLGAGAVSPVPIQVGSAALTCKVYALAHEFAHALQPLSPAQSQVPPAAPCTAAARRRTHCSGGRFAGRAGAVPEPGGAVQPESRSGWRHRCPGRV